MQTVKVRLRKPTRVYTFLSKEAEIRRNDNLIVRSDRGLEFGTCILPPESCAEEMEQRYKMSVVRKATPGDLTSFMQIQIDEGRAMEIAREKVESRNLPMKLVDVEYTFDKQRVIFYFVAADRVDFRQLVRDLAQELKTRIELRHIQVRDEAKIKGGLGVCGRELCCSTWLTEFKPISMKMAKRQNLSLNPSKISGQCGRLLCCLAYENEVYQMRKRDEQAAAAQYTEREEYEEPAARAVTINTTTGLEEEPVTVRREKDSESGGRPRSARRDDRGRGSDRSRGPDRGPRRDRDRKPDEAQGRGPKPDQPQTAEPQAEAKPDQAPEAKRDGEGAQAEGAQGGKRRGRRRRRRRNRPGGGSGESS